MRTRFDQMQCSVAQSLEVLGDWWTLLIIRDAFLGTRRFSDFQEHLGIARNVLTQRLAHLVEHGVLERVDVGEHGTHYEYALTAMGKDLAVVMTALRQWGDRWLFGPGKEPMLVYDRRTNRPIPPLRIRGEDGAPLRAADMEVRPGPGLVSPELQAAVAARPVGVEARGGRARGARGLGVGHLRGLRHRRDRR